jgi:hypothetical protein
MMFLLLLLAEERNDSLGAGPASVLCNNPAADGTITAPMANLFLDMTPKTRLGIPPQSPYNLVFYCRLSKKMTAPLGFPCCLRMAVKILKDGPSPIEPIHALFVVDMFKKVVASLPSAFIDGTNILTSVQPLGKFMRVDDRPWSRLSFPSSPLDTIITMSPASFDYFDSSSHRLIFIRSDIYIYIYIYC